MWDVAKVPVVLWQSSMSTDLVTLELSALDLVTKNKLNIFSSGQLFHRCDGYVPTLQLDRIDFQSKLDNDNLFCLADLKLTNY